MVASYSTVQIAVMRDVFGWVSLGNHLAVETLLRASECAHLAECLLRPRLGSGHRRKGSYVRYWARFLCSTFFFSSLFRTDTSVENYIYSLSIQIANLLFTKIVSIYKPLRPESP